MVAPGTLIKILEQTPIPGYTYKHTEPDTIRARTDLTYPNGDIIDIFIYQHNNRYSITDYGETFYQLQLQHPNLQISEKQQQTIQHLREQNQLTTHGNQLTYHCEKPDEIETIIPKLAQLAHQVSRLQP